LLKSLLVRSHIAILYPGGNITAEQALAFQMMNIAAVVVVVKAGVENYMVTLHYHAPPRSQPTSYNHRSQGSAAHQAQSRV